MDPLPWNFYEDPRNADAVAIPASRAEARCAPDGFTKYGHLATEPFPNCTNLRHKKQKRRSRKYPGLKSVGAGMVSHDPRYGDT